MGRFNRQIEMAFRLIKKNGQIVNWKQITAGTPNLEEPWNQEPDEIFTYTPYIYFLPLDLEGKQFLMSFGSTEAVSGTYYGLMGAVGFTPDIKDTVIRDDVPLEIKSIDLLNPNGQKILYTIIFNG